MVVLKKRLDSVPWQISQSRCHSHDGMDDTSVDSILLTNRGLSVQCTVVNSLSSTKKIRPVRTASNLGVEGAFDVDLTLFAQMSSPFSPAQRRRRVVVPSADFDLVLHVEDAERFTSDGFARV